MLNDLPKPFVVQLLDLVHREGKPKRNAAKTVMAAWLAQNAPMLAKEMPPCASFSFVEVFDKAQRDVYKYLHRKYDTETDWYTGAEHPAGCSCGRRFYLLLPRGQSYRCPHETRFQSLPERLHPHEIEILTTKLHLFLLKMIFRHI